ncbi:MAG: type II toxin-antitoxin system RelE/ParE family toxin [Armatimonadota bacterium]
MRIKILNVARQDLLEAYWFYESQEPGLGMYFFDSLLSDIDSLQLYAGIHAKHFGRFHRMLAKRFPFAIYYKVEDDSYLFTFLGVI